MASETLDESLKEQDEVENIGNLKFQFETDEIHEGGHNIQHEDIENPPCEDDDIQLSESFSSTGYDWLEQERL